MDASCYGKYSKQLTRYLSNAEQTYLKNIYDLSFIEHLANVQLEENIHQSGSL